MKTDFSFQSETKKAQIMKKIKIIWQQIQPVFSLKHKSYFWPI